MQKDIHIGFCKASMHFFKWVVKMDESQRVWLLSTRRRDWSLAKDHGEQATAFSISLNVASPQARYDALASLTLK